MMVTLNYLDLGQTKAIDRQNPDVQLQHTKKSLETRKYSIGSTTYYICHRSGNATSDWRVHYHILKYLCRA